MALELGQHKIALQFSGGRDSLALLLYMRPHWDDLTVYYCNSGDAYPETLALVQAVKAVVPSFVEVNGKVKETHAEHGWCSDVLHAQATWTDTYRSGLKLIDRHTCCYHSIMKPLHDRMKADGVTLILRGQRDEDEPKSPVQHGQTIDGFTIGLPIASWSTEDVQAFIEQAGLEVPQYYREGMTSAPDCMHCTAWLEHGAVKYLRKNHPTVAKEVNRRLLEIKIVVQSSMDRLNAALEDSNGSV